MQNGLSINQSPALHISMRFFITAPLMLITGGVSLLLVNTGEPFNHWLPDSIAITHLISLGFVMMIIGGALFQFLPVLGGKSLSHLNWWANLIHGALVVGLVLFTSGLAGSLYWILLIGATLLLISLGSLFCLVQLSINVTRSKSPALRMIQVASWALLLGLGFATLLAHGHLNQAFALNRSRLLMSHILWTLGGFVMPLIAGIATKIVPMFFVSPEYPKYWQKQAATYWLAGLAFHTLLIWLPDAWQKSSLYQILWILAWAGMLLWILLFSILTLRCFQKRQRRYFDPAVLLWQAGMLILLIGCGLVWPLGILALLLRSQGQMRALGMLLPITGSNIQSTMVAVFLLGFGLSIIQAMLLKIVPFLMWLKLLNQGDTDGPNMDEFFDDRLNRIQITFFGTLLSGLVIQPYFNRPGILLIAIGLCGVGTFLLLNMARALDLYRRHRSRTIPKNRNDC